MGHYDKYEEEQVLSQKNIFAIRKAAYTKDILNELSRFRDEIFKMKEEISAFKRLLNINNPYEADEYENE